LWVSWVSITGKSGMSMSHVQHTPASRRNVLVPTRLPFRGRRSGLIKLLWHDGVGMCLFIKRLERGQFIWPMSSAGTVSLTPGQLSTLLEGCEWRATARNLRPELAG
jgi:transposase